jgi:hypothetical protein
MATPPVLVAVSMPSMNMKLPYPNFPALSKCLFPVQREPSLFQRAVEEIPYPLTIFVAGRGCGAAVARYRNDPELFRFLCGSKQSSAVLDRDHLVTLTGYNGTGTGEIFAITDSGAMFSVPVWKYSSYPRTARLTKGKAGR